MTFKDWSQKKWPMRRPNVNPIMAGMMGYFTDAVYIHQLIVELKPKRIAR